MGRMKYIFQCILHMDYKALLETVNTVHRISGKNRVWLLYDIVRCGFRYGAGYKDYLLCEFFNLNDAQRATFVTRGINNTIIRMLNDPSYSHTFDNKIEFCTAFSEYMHRDWLSFSDCTEAQFADFMADKDAVISKPCDASCGVGVEKVEKADYPSLHAMYEALKQNGTDLVEEVVIQHPDMSRINPGSVNTIRVYTVLSDGVANVVYACIRMGNSDRPVDNINAGGMYSPVNLETGKIACAACDKQRIVYETHPRTGCRLEGYQIPFWKEVLDMCREAAYKIPQMGYIGWDVAITEDGPLFIEANNLPGHDAFPQMPLQAPDKIGILPVFKKYIKGL